MVNGKFGNFNTHGIKRVYLQIQALSTDYNRGIICADASCLNVRFVKGPKEIGEYRGVLVKQYIDTHKYVQNGNLYTKR